MSTAFPAGEHEQETTFISLVLFELYTTGIYCFCKQKKAIKTKKRRKVRRGVTQHVFWDPQQLPTEAPPTFTSPLFTSPSIPFAHPNQKNLCLGSICPASPFFQPLNEATAIPVPQGNTIPSSSISSFVVYKVPSHASSQFIFPKIL